MQFYDQPMNDGQTKPRINLAGIPLGTAARIQAVLVSGAERERLHNHGFIEQNIVVPEREAPLKGARVYRVMNTLVALRRDLAEKIEVVLEEAHLGPS